MDDIGLEYRQKQRGFEQFPEPEAKSEAFSTVSYLEIVRKLGSCRQDLERNAGQTVNYFEASLLSEALHNVKSALLAMEQL